MKRLLIGLLIFNFLPAFAKRSWNKYYRLVNSDIRSVEALKSKGLGLQVRLFELYGEKLSLLIERERDYRIEFLETGNNKKINILVKKQNRTLKKLDDLGSKIERSTKDKKVITKINYFRSLNYLSIKNDEKFFFYMKKAEQTNSDKKIAYNINTKLANYYYNNNRFLEASIYYKKLLYDKKSPWLTKHYFNLSWSELKQDRYMSALKYLKKAYIYERRKGYYRIGEQIIDSLILFHAYAKKTKSGIAYLRKYKLDKFDYLLKYLHYVFGHGRIQDSGLVVEEIEKKKLSIEEEYLFLEKKILVYRSLKRFAYLQKELAKFKKRIRKFKPAQRKLTGKTKDALVLSIKGYSGYLQELVKSQRLISDEKKRNYIPFITYNFSVLREIDKENSLEYSFFEGETHFSQKSYSKATLVYIRGLKTLRKRKRKKDKYLSKTFESLFKSLENEGRPKKSSLLYAYNSYIYFYPKTKKSNAIFQRLIALYSNLKDQKNKLKTLGRYNKLFPNMIKVQRSSYRQVLNFYIDRKNIKALRSLQRMVKKKFLGLGKKEILSIEKVIKEIRFAKFEALAKKGNMKEAIDGFYRLFNDKKGNYGLRVDALRKAMFYQNKTYLYIELSKSIQLAIGFMKEKDKKQHHDELMFYAQNICYGDYQKSCLGVLNIYKKDKNFKLTASLNNFYFKLTTLYSLDFKKDYQRARTSANKNFIFKLLLLKDKDFSDELFLEFYKDSKMKGLIDGEVERMVLNMFYNTLDLDKTTDYIKTISIPSLRKHHLGEIVNLSKILKRVDFKLPPTPKEKVITEEIFVNFGKAVEMGVERILNHIQSVINDSSPNYLPLVLSRVVLRFESELNKFKKFIPVSNNADFEAAMTDAVENFHRILDGKNIEYRSLYYKTLQNTVKGSGVKKYGNDIMIKAKLNSYNQVRLWQN